MFPVKALNAPSGIKLPVNGAPPDAIAVVAEALKTVFTKLSPPPPLRLLRLMVLPDGAISCINKSPS